MSIVFTSRRRYHDPQSVATSCSKAFCRLDELEVFGQPHTLEVVLAAITGLLDVFPDASGADASPKDDQKGSIAGDATGSSAVYEPGMLENGARFLRALPTVDFELTGVRVLISDFDVFFPRHPGTRCAKEQSSPPLQ